MNTGSAWEKRALSVLLTVIMVFSMVPLSVFAASGEAEVTVNGSTTNFNSFAGAVEYANAYGGTLRLLSDVEVPQSENPDDIPSITDAISGITADNVKSSDGETISSVERQILDIAEAFDDGESTEGMEQADRSGGKVQGAERAHRRDCGGDLPLDRCREWL